jgi:hypothetical protein
METSARTDASACAEEKQIHYLVFPPRGGREMHIWLEKSPFTAAFFSTKEGAPLIKTVNVGALS